MNFKDCVTWKEIAQQPGIWKEEVSIVKENIEEPAVATPKENTEAAVNLDTVRQALKETIKNNF